MASTRLLMLLVSVVLTYIPLLIATQGSLVPTPAPYTHCEYEGQYYSLAQRWQIDNCTSCYCMAPAMNASVCGRSCYQYTQLPAHCRLEIQPGRCCPEVFCDFFHKCLYHGRYYNQNETWEVGCERICTCADAQTSYIRCRQRCPTYTLPASCFLIPPATGGCCPTLSCGSIG